MYNMCLLSWTAEMAPSGHVPTRSRTVLLGVQLLPIFAPWSQVGRGTGTWRAQRGQAWGGNLYTTLLSSITFLFSAEMLLSGAWLHPQPPISSPETSEYTEGGRNVAGTHWNSSLTSLWTAVSDVLCEQGTLPVAPGWGCSGLTAL